MDFNNPAAPVFPHYIVTVIPENTAPFGGANIRLHVTPTLENDTSPIDPGQTAWLESALSDLETALAGSADIADVQVRKHTEDVTVV